LKTITVKAKSKHYHVYVGDGILNRLPNLVSKKKLPDRVFVVIDKKVEQIYGKSIRKVVNSIASKKYFLVLTSNEKLKSFNTITEIFDRLFEQKFGKDTLIIAIGGGTIGDVAGFAASTYMRGVPLVHIPTTLLSAVDSSIGGKTGINFRQAKNLIGSLYHPEIVLIDTNFISSLLTKDLISGMGEVVKYSYLTDKKFYQKLLDNFELILQKDSDLLSSIIYESIKIKSAVVSQDEKEETGVRKILNFGHTFAHAYESNLSYKIDHGKAVVAGIVNALCLSLELKLIDNHQYKYMIELPMKFRSYLKQKKVTPKALNETMQYDKKNRQGNIQFVLIRNFGEILVDVQADYKSIKKSLERSELVWFKRATAGL